MEEEDQNQTEEVEEPITHIESVAHMDAKKKKKKKKPAPNTIHTEEISAPVVEMTPDPTQTIAGMTQAELWRFFQDQEAQKRAARRLKKESTDHKFWNTQPVLQEGEGSAPLTESSIAAMNMVNEPIEYKTVEEVKQDPYGMPAGFEWCDLDVSNPASQDLQDLYTLLTENYVEDDEAHFRFDYSVPFLYWALAVPGYHPDWIVGVKATKTGKLMGCITGIPVHVQVRGRQSPMCEINFLCVHKKLRDKRLAPVLIKEITRRVNLRDIWQAVYTAGIVLPTPVARCRYYHRTLNAKKLIDVKFAHLPPRTTLAAHINSLRLPKHPTPGIRPLTPADLPSAHRLLTEYLTRTQLSMVFSEEEFAHVFLPREGVVNSYVISDPTTGQVTDFSSFYHLPSTILGHPTHSSLSAVYSYYHVATSLSFEDLMQSSLILARDIGVDVYNALDLMENRPVFDSLKFGTGDGTLQYYLYNWRTPEMRANEIGLVLL